MFHKKRRLTYISRTKHGTEAPQSAGSRTFIYPISIMAQIFIEESRNLKHPKNVKTDNNTTSSHLVKSRVIPR